MTLKIFDALGKVQKEIDFIAKDQQGYGYKYRGIDQVMNHLGHLFKDHGIIVTREATVVNMTHRPVTIKKTKDGVETITERDYTEAYFDAVYKFISTEDGSSTTSSGNGHGQDTSGGDKALGMAQSNAYKYVIFELFTIPTEEQKDSDQVAAEEAGIKKKFTTAIENSMFAAIKGGKFDAVLNALPKYDVPKAKYKEIMDAIDTSKLATLEEKNNAKK